MTAKESFDIAEQVVALIMAAKTSIPDEGKTYDECFLILQMAKSVINQRRESLKKYKNKSDHKIRTALLEQLAQSGAVVIIKPE